MKASYLTSSSSSTTTTPFLLLLFLSLPGSLLARSFLLSNCTSPLNAASGPCSLFIVLLLLLHRTSPFPKLTRRPRRPTPPRYMYNYRHESLADGPPDGRRICRRNRGGNTTTIPPTSSRSPPIPRPPAVCTSLVVRRPLRGGVRGGRLALAPALGGGRGRHGLGLYLFCVSEGWVRIRRCTQTFTTIPINLRIRMYMRCHPFIHAPFSAAAAEAGRAAGSPAPALAGSAPLRPALLSRAVCSAVL